MIKKTEKKSKKMVVGKVVSDKMQKTVVVEVEWLTEHPMYHKRIHHSGKYHAHNDLGAKVGDEIKMEEIRPMSKTKNWKVVEILNKEPAKK
jgi:small subunit ribosomal protein S17